MQLKQRLTNKRKQVEKLRLNRLNIRRCSKQLNKTIEIYQRFMMFIKDNDISKLKQLISGCLNRGRSIHFILEKMKDAVANLYNPRCDESQRKLGFVLLQFGGPRLVDIMHRALGFPSSSVLYRMLKTDMPLIKTSIDDHPSSFIFTIFQ